MSGSQKLFLETADFLGARLCRDAIWAGKRCNWVGAQAVELTRGATVAAHRACGPELYGGTSGIAAFLARLYASTGEKIFRTTAEGALRQALARLDDFPLDARAGFYTGLTGIAYVLIELAEIFDTRKFAAMALLILEEVCQDDPARQGVDVMSGSAGVITALLKFHRRQPEDFLLETALRHGEHLAGAIRERDAERSTGALEQDAHQLKQGVHVGIGFAHGMAGIAWALLELYHATGRENFRHAAEQAFQFERQRLNDAGHDDWSRSDWTRSQATRVVPPAQSGAGFARPLSWSHGAAGIGLARLRAFELLGDHVYLEEAQAALRAITETLSGSSSQTAQENFSLGDGLTGYAELLLYADRVLGDEAHQRAAARVGELGIELYRKGNMPWACGAPGGAETPGLMPGLAGIGYCYLRLHDARAAPSLLMVLPEGDAA